MWRSSQGLLGKLTAKVGSGVVVSVRQRRMSTVMSFGEGWNGALGLPSLGMGKGAKAYKPTMIPFLPSDIVSIHVSFGEEHALALTVDGKLFRWGFSKDQAIGTRSIIWKPRLFKVRRGIQVLDIACGSHHSLILCRDGTLLSCGTNYNGQLGREFPYAEHTKCLPVELSFRPMSVAAGPYHSMAICQLDESNGANVGTTKVASWGWNRHSQLGRGWRSIELPGLIDGFDGENPVSISVGVAHSLALTSKGKLWVWGSSLDGTLGLKSPEVQCEPYYLDSLEGFQILQVVAGHYHNLVLVAD